MRMSRKEYSLLVKRIKETDAVPKYLPSEEDIRSIEDKIDKYLSYLLWVYIRFPRTGDAAETEDLERIRPLLKNIHVSSK